MTDTEIIRASEIDRAAIAAGKLAARVAALGYATLAGDLRLTKSQLEQAARMSRNGGRT